MRKSRYNVFLQVLMPLAQPNRQLLSSNSKWMPTALIKPRIAK
jgi:hypothetical protein